MQILVKIEYFAKSFYMNWNIVIGIKSYHSNATKSQIAHEIFYWDL